MNKILKIISQRIRVKEKIQKEYNIKNSVISPSIYGLAWYITLPFEIIFEYIKR